MGELIWYFWQLECSSFYQESGLYSWEKGGVLSDRFGVNQNSAIFCRGPNINVCLQFFLKSSILNEIPVQYGKFLVW